LVADGEGGEVRLHASSSRVKSSQPDRNRENLMRRRHKRLDFAGSLHFVTTVTRERGNWFVSDFVCSEILTIFEHYRKRYGLDCYGYVLMPDHFHALLLQSTEDLSVSQLMNSFKRETSKFLNISDYPADTLWQHHYDDVPIPGPRATMTRLEYMHNNPVRRGLVAQATDYLWSSARFHFDLSNQSLITLMRPLCIY
jgi:putative transposase